VQAGSIVDVTLERNTDEEHRQQQRFKDIQHDIFKKYGQEPIPPVIRVKSVTQTSVTISWEPLRLQAATYRGIDIYNNGQKLNIKCAPSAISVKIGGLDVAHDYDIWVVLRTSAGAYESNRVAVKTHAIDNLTGLHVCFGMFSNEADIPRMKEVVKRIGASYSDELTVDNTHLVCTVPRGKPCEKALQLNIPIVSPEFLKACEQERRVVPAHPFHLKS
jgi:hypothetical protein